MRSYIFQLFIRILAILWLLLAMLCASPFQKVFARTVLSTTAPAISINIGSSASNTVSSGAKVTVVGSQFGPIETIAVVLNGTSLTLTPNPTVSGINGSFSATFVVPNITSRVYVLSATGQISGISATTMLWMKAKKEALYSPIASSDSFTVTDTYPREPQGQYVRITNTGDATIVGPRLFPDSLPGSQDPYLDTSSLQNLVNGILAANPQATTPPQIALAIWTWMTHYTYHFYDPEKPDPKTHEDFIGLLDVYGFTRCWQHARLMTDLLTAAGLQGRAINLGGHAVSEVFYNNSWHVYDIDQHQIYVGSDGTTVLGTPDLISNPDPMFLHTDGTSSSYAYEQGLADIYTTTYNNLPLNYAYPPISRSLYVTLRKNETFIQNWNNIGKYHDIYLHLGSPVSYTDGDLIYTPDLTKASYQNGVYSSSNVSAYSNDGLSPNLHATTPGTTSSIVYQVNEPYTLVGSLLQAQTYLATATDSMQIAFSLDGTNWTTVYTQSKLGYDNPQLDLSNYVNNNTTLPEQFQYFIKFQWTANSAANAAGVNSFTLDSQFQQAWEAIPPLHSGTTTIKYADQSNNASYAPNTVDIAYGWNPQGAPTNYSNSTLTASQTTIPANGNSFATISAKLNNSTNNHIANLVVRLVSTGTPVNIYRQYKYQGLREQTDTSGGATFQVSSIQPGTATVTLVDKNGNPVPNLSPIQLTFTQPVFPALTSSEGNTFVNGNFSTGDFTGWTTTGGIPPVITTTGNNSTNSAQLGSSAPSGNAVDSGIYETLTIPTNLKSLAFDYQFSNSNNDAGNYLEIWVRDTAGDPIYQIAKITGNSTNWQTAIEPSLSQFAGNTVQIYFNVHQDGSNNPAFALITNVTTN
jgi:hypothetical protein